MENINFSTLFKNFVSDVKSSGFNEKIEEMKHKLLLNTGYHCVVNFCEHIKYDEDCVDIIIEANRGDKCERNYFDGIELSLLDHDAVSKARLFIERTLFKFILEEKNNIHFKILNIINHIRPINDTIFEKLKVVQKFQEMLSEMLAYYPYNSQD